MTEKTGITPIMDKFLQENYLFALGYREGFIFGRVVYRRICQYKPWLLIDANGTAVDITGQSGGSTCYRFRDPRNTQFDILYTEDESNTDLPWIMHGAIGIKPNWIRMYLTFPEEKDIPGKFPSLDPIDPTRPDNFGYVTGQESPYETPTDYLELIIPPKIHICAKYRNMDKAAHIHRPALNLTFCIYWFQPLNLRDHRALIGKIARREIPARFFRAGVAEKPLDFGFDFEKAWGVTPITLDEAARISSSSKNEF